MQLSKIANHIHIIQTLKYEQIQAEKYDKYKQKILQILKQKAQAVQIMELSQIANYMVKEGVNEKKTFSLPELPNPPPMTPIWATWSSFFGSRNSTFESQFRTKNTLYTI